jgi:hypothetical protein
MKMENTENKKLAAKGELKNLRIKLRKINQLDLISEPKSISYIHMNNAGIKKYPSLSEFINLKKINLSNNRIEIVNLTESFSKICGLILTNNRIKKFNVKCTLPNLTHLNLTSNKLEEFNVENKLPNLKNLILTDNFIEEVDFSSMKKLDHVNLSENKIQEINWLNLPTNIRYLNFSLNPLIVPLYIPYIFIERMKKMKILNMYGTPNYKVYVNSDNNKEIIPILEYETFTDSEIRYPELYKWMRWFVIKIDSSVFFMNE